jgi:DNA polymerase III delta prime subunit
MATIHPPIPDLRLLTAGSYRERDVLLALESSLSVDYHCYHSVNWAAVTPNRQHHGEFDIVVLTPAAHLLVLEVKAALPKLEELRLQLSHQRDGIRGRLNAEKLEQIRVEHFLVLTDNLLPSGAEGTIGLPLEKIIDSAALDTLPPRIREFATRSPTLDKSIHAKVQRFLENRFKLLPDPTTHIGQVRRASTVLAEGLATWVPRIHDPNGVYLIEGTAGSGKTQLALALMRHAVGESQRTAYFCFNRPLADHIARVAPNQAIALTFHEFCLDFQARTLGQAIDFSKANVFAAAEAAFLSAASELAPRWDLLVIDEAQDFEPDWIHGLISCLSPEGSVYILSDADQAVHPRPAIELDGGVKVVSPENFRSPKRIVQAINQLRLSNKEILARSPFVGESPEFHIYRTGTRNDEKAQLDALYKCLRGLVNDGFSTDEIALLSFAGRDNSLTLKQDRIGAWTLKRFTGKFDKSQNAIWTQGDLLTDTIARFKGQSAPVVVVTEVDFTEPTPRDLMKLFVGFTRAQYRCECVLSEEAEKSLYARL